jgi:hypothetical protein
MLALKTRGAGYIGMIGGERKVQRVFDQLRKRKVSKQELAKLYALPARNPVVSHWNGAFQISTTLAVLIAAC